MIYQNLIINTKIWEQLEKMYQTKKIPHALLFHGPDGSGKEAHAIELAALLNYKTKADLEKIKIFQHPNIQLITPLIKDKKINKNSNALDALSTKSLEEYIDFKKQKMLNPYKKITFQKTSTILINSIRDIKKNTQYHNSERYMVYLIFEAEKLCYPKNEAGNALLKVLEEPPSKTIFILVTSYKEKILDTILSRCCDFYYQKLTNDEIVKYLKNNHYQHENNNLLIKLCDNNLNLIIKMIEEKIDLNLMIEKSKKLIEIAINNKPHQECVRFIEKLFQKNKIEFEIYIKVLIIMLSDFDKLNNNYGDIMIINKNEKMKKLDYITCIKIIEKYCNQLSKNLNPAIGIFAMMIEIKKTLT